MSMVVPSCTLLECAGERFVVHIEPAGELCETAVLDSETDQRATRVRAIPSASHDLGREALAEDAEAEWWCEATHPVTGHSMPPSGGALMALAHALISTKTVQLTDRRNTVAIATAHGIRDVLPGRAGYAVDLGRWRFLPGRDTTVPGEVSDDRHRPADMTVLISALKVDVRAVAAASGVQSAHQISEGVSAVAQATGFTVAHGVAQASIRVTDADGAEKPSDTTAAAAAALTLRHGAPRDTPQHWSVSMPGGSVGVRMFATEEGEHVSVSAAVEVLPEDA